jgi:hypothetical protein
LSPKKKEPENKPPEYKLCPNGHKNGPNAKVCWVCGESLEAPPKPTFTQKTNTDVISEGLNPTPTPKNFNDVNIVVPSECEKYVGKRERCDEKDPSGLMCTWIHNCAIRLERYKKKQSLDVKQV